MNEWIKYVCPVLDMISHPIDKMTMTQRGASVLMIHCYATQTQTQTQ